MQEVWEQSSKAKEKAGSLKMLEYLTSRELKDSDGKVKGRVKIVKEKGKNHAQIFLLCPACGAEEQRSEEWKEPFLKGSGLSQKFRIVCGRCGFCVELQKLRKEIKKKS